MRISCIQHVPFEKPGMIETWALTHRHAFSIVHPYAGQSFPDLSETDMLVIMGGPMGVYEENQYPWMKAEKYGIEKAIQAGKKVLGVCLGAQLIANVLGARVYPHEEKEIGWFPVYPENTNPAENPYAALFMPRLTVFHWHGDTFDLPSGAINLASSSACRHQMFTWSNHVMGLQFHLEVGKENVEQMLRAGHAEVNEALARQPKASFVQQPEYILAQTSLHAAACHQCLQSLLDIFTKDV
ncbi:GMP synthase (glutamine-hydrolysing) [Thermoflavifilum thermophilum]|uniref:GMP synthase (Glutamine-hydrolysing) n=2 Tax=Thermoflavifilum thermophilum TaxID=1393122 RepID=A0A1I7N9S0_9BACT|nr:GMP synthase (glutamine-hydrolysing) [Thermoflavifilum thermophilum]